MSDLCQQCHQKPTTPLSDYCEDCLIVILDEISAYREKNFVEAEMGCNYLSASIAVPSLRLMGWLVGAVKGYFLHKGEL